MMFIAMFDHVFPVSNVILNTITISINFASAIFCPLIRTHTDVDQGKEILGSREIFCTLNE